MRRVQEEAHILRAVAVGCRLLKKISFDRVIPYYMNFFLPISMKVSRGIYELFGTNDMGKAGLSELGGRGAIAPPTQILVTS